MDNKITKKRISEHLEYDWFMYIVLLLAAIFLWVFIYSVSDQLKEYEKIDFFCIDTHIPAAQSGKFNEKFPAYLAENGDDAVKTVNFEIVDSGDATTFSTLLSTHGASADLLIAPIRRGEKDGESYTSFDTLVEQGFIVPLDRAGGEEYFDVSYYDPDALYTYTAAAEDVYAEEGAVYGIILNSLGLDVLALYGQRTDADGESYIPVYAVGVIFTNLMDTGCGAGSGGGNKGNFNATKQDTSNAQAFDCLKYIYDYHSLFTNTQS